MAPRIVLLVTSPRLPAGLLTAEAWDLLRAYPVYTARPGPHLPALAAVGVEARVGPVEVATLVEAARQWGAVVWLAGPDGDPDLTRRIGLDLARAPGTADLELVYGSWDPPGARLLDAVAAMDRLLSPGGDPWKRAQTHHTLARFLLEEAYEAIDAIDAGDTDALREELGDVLLQVVLHARLAQELPEEHRWTVDDVAGGLVEKLVRRNPHVFGDVVARDVEEVVAVWEASKRAEKARDSVLDGIARSQPALALAGKILSRVQRSGLDVPPPPGAPVGGVAVAGSGAEGSGAAESGAEGSGAAESGAAGEDALGARLLAEVAVAVRDGLDAEGALRRAALAYAARVRAAERGSGRA
jgi:XTP/dITP diphosphohydrolase